MTKEQEEALRNVLKENRWDDIVDDIRQHFVNMRTDKEQTHEENRQLTTSSETIL